MSRDPHSRDLRIRNLNLQIAEEGGWRPTLQLEADFSEVMFQIRRGTPKKKKKLTALIIQVIMPMYNKTKLDCVYDTE